MLALVQAGVDSDMDGAVVVASSCSTHIHIQCCNMFHHWSMLPPVWDSECFGGPDDESAGDRLTQHRQPCPDSLCVGKESMRSERQL